ncbi:branched-chain amino acid ABC transporter permease [Micrococcus sp. IITD107]|uniref:branched-chain amino acid ABC transporter permease n=1 Tax=Micrococcus sp. IITD107 TaxID=3342790 RepID=UPI0035B886E1
MQIVNYVLNGLSLGMIYAAFALALVLIYRATRIVNFAQAPMAMVSTFIALTVIEAGGNYWLAFAVALISGFLLGAVVERVIIRPVEGKSPINAVILTLGLFTVLHAVAAIIFGSSFQSFPAPFGLDGIRVGEQTFALTGFGIFTIVAVLVVMFLLLLLFQKTTIGLRMRASAFNQEVARLLGVRVGRMLTLGWALAGLVGALSGVLIAGGNFVHPAYMDAVVVYGFAAAVIGGLDSPVGSVVGGLTLGVLFSLVAGFGGAQLLPLVAFVVLMVVLLVKPDGLFSRTATRSV